MFDSYKTAIKRNKPSAPARYVVKHIIPKYAPELILDWGCGWGADIRYYKSILGHHAYVYGYDPGPEFGFHAEPENVFDLITCTYVLNVVMDYKKVIDDLLYYLNRNGKIFLTARSKNSVDSAATKGNWESVNFFSCVPVKEIMSTNPNEPVPIKTGFLSAKNKNTFQHGLTHDDYKEIAKEFNLKILPIENYKISGAVSALMERK